MKIAIASQKGGTGKTTSSISLAAGLGRLGKKVLLIDIDSQANSSKELLPHYQNVPIEETLHRTILERKPLFTHKANVPDVDIVPAHILLSNTDIELTTAMDHREARLSRQLEKVQDQYDHVIIDCPPALSWLTVNAFTAADAVIVTVAPGYFELDSITQILKTLEEVRDFYNSSLRLMGFLFTKSDPTINTRTSLKVLRQAYTDRVFNTVIPRNTDIRAAHFQKQDIFSYKPNAKSALAYLRLIEELQL